MNEDIFQGKWNQLKGSAKQTWGKLTDDDLRRAEGSFDKFVGTLQERYGWERDRTEREVNDYFDRQGWTTQRA
jgi:uncharacterized protein YjbJ (UPF0337 family)